MHPDLSKLDAGLAGALLGLTPSQTQAVPSAELHKWSIQQIAEHLLQTYRGSLTAIVARVERGSVTRAQPSLRQRLGQFRILSLGCFPHGRLAPAAVSPTQPVTIRGGDDLLTRLNVEILKLDQATAHGERLFGHRRAVSHLILGPLSMQQWRRFHLVHGLHHIRQIHAIRRDHGFY